MHTDPIAPFLFDALRDSHPITLNICGDVVRFMYLQEVEAPSADVSDLLDDLETWPNRTKVHAGTSSGNFYRVVGQVYDGAGQLNFSKGRDPTHGLQVLFSAADLSAIYLPHDN